MKKLLFILLLAPAVASAVSCPQWTYPENHKLDSEFNNLCQQLQNPTFNNVTASSITATFVSSSTGSFKQLTVTSGTATSFSIVNGTGTNFDIVKTTITTAYINALTYGSLSPAIAANVLQVVFSSNTTDGSSSSLSFVDTSLALKITPTSSVTHVLIGAFFEVYGQTGSGNFYTITGTTNGNLCTASGCTQFRPAATNQLFPMSVAAIDTPGTISQQTYKVQMKVDSSTGNWGNGGTHTMFAVEFK